MPNGSQDTLQPFPWVSKDYIEFYPEQKWARENSKKDQFV